MTLITTQDVLKRHSAASPAAAAETISFTVGESALGQILVARSAAGVTAILIGGEAAELEADLAARFPEARLARNDATIREDLAKVMRFLDTPAVGLDLSLDLRGTPFQHRVWEALRLIPAGTTTTYTAIARGLEAPKAVRAVAAACAANPIALAVPCHRVVRSDGNLAGYRWGIERKRVLLNREAMV